MQVTVVLDANTKEFLGIFGSPALARATVKVTFSDCGGVVQLEDRKIMGYTAEVFRGVNPDQSIHDIAVVEMMVLDIVDHL